MVTTYQLICIMAESPNLTQFIKAGLISFTLLDYKLVYEFYCAQKARGIRHSEAITFTAEEFGKSEQMIWKIKYKLESTVD